MQHLSPAHGVWDAQGLRQPRVLARFLGHTFSRVVDMKLEAFSWSAPPCWEAIVDISATPAHVHVTP